MASPAAKTTRELAGLLGISQPVLVRATKKPDWPVRRAAPWSAADVAAIVSWRAQLQPDRSAPAREAAAPAASGAATHPQAGSNDAVLLRQVELLLKKERMLHEKRKREILEEQFILRDLVDGSMGGLAALFVQILDDLELSAPVRFGNKTGEQVAAIAGPLFDSYRQRLLEKAELELVRIADLSKSVAGRRRGRPSARGNG